MTFVMAGGDMVHYCILQKFVKIINRKQVLLQNEIIL